MCISGSSVFQSHKCIHTSISVGLIASKLVDRVNRVIVAIGFPFDIYFQNMFLFITSSFS